jgi:hypothetical protein
MDAVYERDSKTVRCVDCEPSPVGLEPGIAGGSARREHERRAKKREDRIRAKHPKIGGLILALTDDPQSTTAWQQGAVGEEILAKRLEDLPDHFRVLHDRRIPGTRANIDHIVITPSGVWVIDAKRYKNKRPSLDVRGRIFHPRTETLRVAGRDRTNLVTGVQSQVDRVKAALAGESTPVTGALCFIEADWPLLGKGFVVNGVHVVWPRMLVERLTVGDPECVGVEHVTAQLARHFQPA